MTSAAESVTTEFGAVDGEELVLVQAIMSIKRIIQQDPPSHEKVQLVSPFPVNIMWCVSAGVLT